MFKFDNAVHSIYEAALNPRLWTKALDWIADTSESDGALLYVKSNREWVIPAHSTGIAAAAESYLLEDWRNHNPWLQGRIPTGFHAGDAYCDTDILSSEEMQTNPFYTDFLPRFGLGHVMVALFQSDLGQPSSVATYRSPEKGHFAPDELARLLLISRHVEQALRIGSAFTKERTAHLTLDQAFDVLDQAAIVLDEKRQAIKVNRTAGHFIGRHFIMSDDGLKPALSAEQRAFTAAVSKAQSTEAADRNAPKSTIVSGPGGDERLVVWVSPLVGASVEQLGVQRQPRNVLVLAKPIEADQLIDPTFVRDVYRLTIGEARLASLLAGGRSIKAASKELGITEGTARIVVKRIFEKTGTHRQSDLIRKLVALAK